MAKQTDTMQKTVADLRLEINDMIMKLSKMQLKNTTSLRTKKDELARVLTQRNMQKTVQQAVSVRQAQGKQAQDEKGETK